MSGAAFTAKSIRNIEQFIAVQSEPEVCPLCHHAMQPVFRFAKFDPPSGSHRYLYATLVYQCPRQTCNSLFLAYYSLKTDRGMDEAILNGRTFTLDGLAPETPQPSAFPLEVVAISPMFEKVYNQASAAETRRLDDVAGPGYGKALEFLIKDYLISLHPDDAEVIKRELLGTAIRTRVSDPNVKLTAERAAWLRNDESHYQRRWDDMDINDLKKLITLTVNWIHSSLLTDAIVYDMPNKNR